MGVKVVFILAFCVLACEGHNYYDWFHGAFGHPALHRYFNDDHPETSKGSCDKSNACPEGQICCLENNHGHCFNNRLKIANSDICLTADELAGGAVGNRCHKDSDCTASGTMCEYSRSNKWGYCVDDLCSGINTGRCGDNGTCVMYLDSHTFECQCDDTVVGHDCSVDHPCELEGFDAVCGSNGECGRLPFTNGVYPEDLDIEDTFSCTCSDGWVGARCNHEHECSKAETCGIGSCAPVGDDYVCFCALNTYGTNCSETCGSSTVIDDLTSTEEISSPDVDDEYPFDIDCEWVIELTNTTAFVTIDFTEFDLEQHPACRWDSLTITTTADPPVAIGGGTNGLYCGDMSTMVNLTSSDHTMKIKFKSDRIISRSGFTATLGQSG